MPDPSSDRSSDPSSDSPKTTYELVGSYDGVKQLVDEFYDLMSTSSLYETIWSLHTQPIDVAKDKLTLFLCGWMSGPSLYQDKYGSINIPKVHAHLVVTTQLRDQWLDCMQEALSTQPIPDDLKKYLLRELSVPAQRIHESTIRKI